MTVSGLRQGQGRGGSPARPAVLVVDDDSAALFTLSEALADLDVEVVVANSGADALRYVLQRDFALILLDVRMPDMDGYEVAAAIRERGKSRRIPLIFLTAIAPEESHIFRGYEAGAVDYVFKPFDLHVLRSKARVFIELYRQREQEKHLLEENLHIRAAMLETERRLRSSEARELLVIRALPIALYEVEQAAAGARRFMNDKVIRLTGFPASQFWKTPELWMERVHPDDATAVAEALARGGNYSIEYRWRCADEAYRYFGDHGVVIEGAAGEPTRVVGAVLDQHERRALEQQLLQAQKMDALGKLTGGIAHDFNNMLTVVIASLDSALRREALPERAEKRIGSALQGALRCADLTERLLGFARNQPLSPVPLDLNSVVHGLTELLERTFGGGIEIAFDLADDLWPIFADRTQMEAAVMNLLVNARDAMPAGGQVTVSAFNAGRADIPGLGDRPGQDAFVVLEIADTGVGMAREVLARAIEPFFTTKEVGQGTGLGLSTIYGFVKESGGQLLIDSTPGEGTRVRICMPRSEVVLPADADAAVTTVESAGGRIPRCSSSRTTAKSGSQFQRPCASSAIR